MRELHLEPGMWGRGAPIPRLKDAVSSKILLKSSKGLARVKGAARQDCSQVPIRGLEGADPAFAGPEACTVWRGTLRKLIQNHTHTQ